MIANMQAVCYKLDVLMVATAGLSVGACLNAATAGYAAVSGGGQGSYDGDQKEFLYPAGGAPAPTPAQTPLPSQGTGAWTPCATEGGRCEFAGSRQVRYGANDRWAYRTALGSIACNNETFGDPIPGVVKQCAYPANASAPGAPGQMTIISANKRTAQSSTAFEGAARLAVDGNTDGNFFAGSVTHSASQQGAWWMVDLGGKYMIESVTVFNRTDCCGDRLNAFVAVTATEGWPNNAVLFRKPLGAPQRVTTVAVSPPGSGQPIRGRYVYVVLNTSDYLSLAEVQVMGRPR